MSFKFSKSIIAAGLICTSLTAIAALAQSSNGETSSSGVPLPPPGPFSSDNNLAAPESAAKKPVGDEKFAPLNFDPEKPAADASASKEVPKPKDNRKKDAEAPKPAYAPAETATIPVEKTPKTKVDSLPTSVGVEVKSDAEAKAPVVEKPAVEAAPEKTLQPKADAVPKLVETTKDDLPKYAPAGTAEAPKEKQPAKTPVNTKVATDAPEPMGEAPSYAPADTAKIPVPEVKADPVEVKKTQEYAPAGTGTAPPPSNTAPLNVAPGYGYQQPQFMPRQFIPPQFRAPQYQVPRNQVPQNQVPQYQNRQYPAPQPAPGYGYAPQYYPPGYVPQQGGWPQQGFWPQQGYQPNQQMQQQPWGNQQRQPQWQQQQPQGYQQPQGQPPQQQPRANQQPQWQQPQWQMPPQGYGYQNPNYWNPFRPPAQQGRPQQNTPRTNNQPGN